MMIRDGNDLFIAAGIERAPSGEVALTCDTRDSRWLLGMSTENFGDKA